MPGGTAPAHEMTSQLAAAAAGPQTVKLENGDAARIATTATRVVRAMLAPRRCVPNASAAVTAHATALAFVRLVFGSGEVRRASR